MIASVPDLPGCHTQAKSLDKLLDRIKEAIELCLEEYGLVEEPSEFMGFKKLQLKHEYKIPEADWKRAY